MIEERYIKITTCRKCEHCGHVTNSVGQYKFTFICANPENMEIEQLPAEKIGNVLYPITGMGNTFEENTIPWWCKLPSKVK